LRNEKQRGAPGSTLEGEGLRRRDAWLAFQI
jgi:hypothetical protein